MNKALVLTDFAIATAAAAAAMKLNVMFRRQILFNSVFARGIEPLALGDLHCRAPNKKQNI